MEITTPPKLKMHSFIIVVLTYSTIVFAETPAIDFINAGCAAGQDISFSYEGNDLIISNNTSSSSASSEVIAATEILEGLRSEHRVLIGGLQDPSKREAINLKRYCIEDSIDSIMNVLTEHQMAQQ